MKGTSEIGKTILESKPSLAEQERLCDEISYCAGQDSCA